MRWGFGRFPRVKEMVVRSISLAQDSRIANFDWSEVLGRLMFREAAEEMIFGGKRLLDGAQGLT